MHRGGCGSGPHAATATKNLLASTSLLEGAIGASSGYAHSQSGRIPPSRRPPLFYSAAVGRAPQMNKSPHARIHSLGQPKWAADFTKSSGSVTLGRHPNATIVLDDQQISMKHVTLEQSVDEQGGRRVTLVESSTNGTIVGHTALAKGDRLVLHHGDEITLPCQEEARRKDYTFRFEGARCGHVVCGAS
jgi:hypothetical protein